MRIILSILLVIFLLLESDLLIAQPININEAKEIAGNYLLSVSNGNLKSAIVKKVMPQFSAVSVAGEEKDTLYYILNDTINDDFVIVAADKRVWPILGYSLDGEYDANNQPPSFVEWMKNREKEIAYISQNNIQPDMKVSQQWESLSSSNLKSATAATSVEPLLKTTWNQGCYYNDLCPADENGYCGGHVPTGCVATSMAQVMKYWNYPTTGTGSYSYSHSTYGQLSANFGSTTYQWSQMPNNVISANNAVATLMFHCGVSVNMNYSPTGSSAGNPRDALVNYFNYSSKANYVYKNNYTETDWITLIKSDLELKRPIWYRGDNGTSGHAFVCDGYQNADYFHFNWGWGGYADGYFYLGSLNPGSYNFNSSQGAIINIIPTSMPDGYSGIFLSDNRLDLSANGKVDSLTVFSSTNWTASSNQSWLTLIKNSGTLGKSSLIMNASENTTASSRSATITLSATGFDDQFITVTQSAKVAVTAGELHNVLAGVLATTTALTLTGTIDARDFKTMRDSMPLLSEIDLSNVTIAAYTGVLGTAGTNSISYGANSIPQKAFYDPVSGASKNSLTSFVCPSSLIAIENYSFVYCRGITSFIIPSTVTSIGWYAFYYCSGLTSIYANSRSPINLSPSQYVFDGVDKTSCVLYVPGGSKSAYQAAGQWKDFQNIVEMPELTLSSTTATIAAKEGSTNSITISSNTSWSVSSNQSWLTLSPASGANNGTLVLTAGANTTASERTAIVTVLATGIPLHTITVTQAAGEGGVPVNTTISSITLTSENTDTCFNASENITVAGDGTSVIFESGSSATLIAGNSIRFLPGFHAQSGSWMDAHITTTNSFCIPANELMLAAQVEVEEKNIAVAETMAAVFIPVEKSIKVYPNPNNGQFFLEVSNFETGATVSIYNMLGSKVYESEMNNEINHKINLLGIKKGVYFVKVTDQKEQFTKKIIIR